MPLANPDHRQHARAPLVLRVSYSDRGQAIDATENLSRGGLFIQTERLWATGDAVTVCLSFPGLMNPVEVKGVVAWIRPETFEARGGVGVQVDDERDREKLGRILSNAGPDIPKGEAQPLPPEGFRVLIVEDNPHIVEMYSYVLKKLASGELGGKVPLQVHFAPDGFHALKLLREQTFNLVMTDLYMPVMDGFALVEKIRQEEKLKAIPVIAISAGGKEAQEKAMDVGVDIFLRKPVKFVEVLETVKQLLRIR